ncbi:MarR family transcriptional regulator [Azohydromonas sp.]|uniref:MarR family winged helix-turn-helix transcriptional regulator n=1 Tax=Azohydromonas sp. TaxID=1872666 RepID=UPI002B5DB55E|nr:MarR family transcriptional regulator [Azohydromonas sp.]HMM86768.1 MarR family transcriptional regulator [Azohydromonas sp.]
MGTVGDAPAATASAAGGAPVSVSAPAAARAGALDESVLAHLVGYHLAKADAPARRTFERHLGAPLRLQPVDFSLLVLLLANGSATPKQLSQALDVAPPKVTLLVDRLAERALLRRQRSAVDGRALDVLLTDAGRDLATQALRISRTMESTLLQSLSPAERAMLVELLAKLARAPA